MEIEIYKDIPGYEGLYQVSNMGNVKSFKWGKERILKKGKDTHGYLNVRLYKESTLKTFMVHKLVSIVFLNHTPNGHETVVNHIDNNPLNNRVDNLELVSNRYNTSCHKTDVGVSWYRRYNKWLSKIWINKQINLGYFNTKEEAQEMYQKAVANIHLYDGNNKNFRTMLS